MPQMRLSIGILVILACASPVSAGELDALAWLSGCWSNPKAEVGSGEYWQPLAGGTLLGVGRTIRNGKTLEYEFLRLHEDEQGRVIYTATPSRQKEASFVASRVSDSGATFENPAHDFPQKIVYTKTSNTSMVVRIEGERHGKNRSVEFSFTRVPCSN
jgi:hypothetical protein